MFRLTQREAVLAGALLISILIGVTVRHVRHREDGSRPAGTAETVAKTTGNP